MSSQLDTHIAEVLAGVTLNVNAFEFWHAREVIQDIIWVAEDFMHRRTMWNASFLSVGCSILDDETLCSSLSK